MTRLAIPLLLLSSCRHHVPPGGFSKREPEPTQCYQMGMDRVLRPVTCEEGR